MSVNAFDRNKVGTADELTPIATLGRNRVWTGTKAAAEVAMKNGDIGNGTVVYITDDYDDKTVIDTANYAVSAGTADTANYAVSAGTADKANTLKAVTLSKTSSYDLNDFRGSEWFGKRITCSNNPNIVNKPTGIILKDVFFGMDIKQVGGTWTEQIFTVAQGTWKRLLKPDGTPYEEHNNGWVKLGVVKTQLKPKQDLNKTVEVGYYYNPNDGTDYYPINYPSNRSSGCGILIVSSTTGQVTSPYIMQIWMPYADPKAIFRRYTNNRGATWTHWFIFNGTDAGN